MGVTKKSASGGLHTKFCSSSSSSSSDADSSSSSESSSSEGEGAGSRKAAPQVTDKAKKPCNSVFSSQWDVKGPVGAAGNPPGNSLGAGSGDGSESRGAGGSIRGGGGRGRRNRRRRNRNKEGRIPGDLIVGGPGDVLTTKSVLYTSPSAAGRNSATSQTPKDMKGAAPSVPATGGETMSTSPGELAGGEVALGAETKLVEIERDYSACPDLQGPPRVGDKLAFKVTTAIILP